MKDHGGFEHNRQRLRVVELLEQKYPRFPGLNLTWEVREGLSKHAAAPGKSTKPAQREAHSLEAQVADIGDEIAYYSHDLDDALTSGLLSEAQLTRDVQIWAEAARGLKRDYGELADECRRYFIIRCIIDSQVKDVVETTEENIAESAIKTADDARACGKSLVRYSQRRKELNLQLRRYLYKNLYFSPEVHEPNRRAGTGLPELFHY